MQPEPAVPAAGLKILFAASEATPFAKTGGLADVVGSLPRAVAKLGHECAVMIPMYRSARKAAGELEPVGEPFEIPIGTLPMTGRLWRTTLPGSAIPVYLIEQKYYFERDDETRGLYQYRVPSGQMRDYSDNFQRFLFFSRAVLEGLPLIGFQPDVIHVNDWQTGLVPVFLKELSSERPSYASIRTLYTIHNLAYQGVFWQWDLALTGLDMRLFNWEKLEAYGHLNLMKGGIVYADAVNTVSPKYAEEIQTRECGCNLEGVLQHYRGKLTGIVNGVDYAQWNPETDPHLPVPYNDTTVSEGKAACKAFLQRRLGLPIRYDVPLLAVISRLAEQKGLDLLRQTADIFLNQDAQLVVLGVGDAPYHQFLSGLQSRKPDKVSATFAFDETLAHQIEAGADMFLMPSRFEPSGLNQLYSLKYGTVPIVRNTGGLSDTVSDCTVANLANGSATGFSFNLYTAGAFLACVGRALHVFRNDRAIWRRLQANGMRQDWSWEHSAKEYDEAYRKLKGRKD